MIHGIAFAASRKARTPYYPAFMSMHIGESDFAFFRRSENWMSFVYKCMPQLIKSAIRQQNSHTKLLFHGSIDLKKGQ